MVKFLIMDVDGTLTDGKIYMGNDGELMKAFCTKDGYGIRHILIPKGIYPVIITGRESRIVANRCKELGITILHQNIQEKLPVLDEILRTFSEKDQQEYTYQDVAYIGDDMNDFSCMNAIRQGGGRTGCPSDAVKEIMGCSDYICTRKGGDGAVREFIEWLVRQ